MIKVQRLTCGACSHLWDHAFNFPQPIKDFIAELNRLSDAGCPSCKVKNRVLLATSTRKES